MSSYLHVGIDGFEVHMNEAFILMPFKESFNKIYKSIQSVCDELNITAKRADNIKNGLIMNNIFDGINHAEIIIADITGNNPNVYLELGLALSRRESAVIIISQSREKASFDIRNWQILQYNPNDLFSFEKDLLSRIQLSRGLFGEEQLKMMLSISTPADKKLINPFIDLLKNLDENNRLVNNICHILSDRTGSEGLSDEVLYEINHQLSTLVDQEDEKYKELANYLRILVFSSPFTLNHFYHLIEDLFLSEWHVDPVTMKELPHRDISSRICFRIIDSNLPQKKGAIEWMMNYLKNKKMGRIDYVRANIARFLVSSKDDEVNKALLESLKLNEPGFVESVIDICGQKCLLSASDHILTILKKSDNPFVVRSSIYALSRLGNTNAAEAIYNWMIGNRDKWGEQAVSSNLRKDAEDALYHMDDIYYMKLKEL